MRCSLAFQELIDVEAPQSHFGPDAVETLFRLLAKIVPKARRIFTGPYHPTRMMHINGYSLERTFVYAILTLSKWMGSTIFPQGITGRWPPSAPKDLVPSVTAPHRVDITDTAVFERPRFPVVLDDANLPPEFRVSASSSSTS